jgi:hypothetical protein
MLDETKEKAIRSIERARSTASGLLHRGINQLRRLRNDRVRLASNCSPHGHTAQAASVQAPELASNCSPHGHSAQAASVQAPELASNCSPHGHAAQAASVQAPELASNCSPTRRIPRSAPCPCGSREKYKRCCGKNAPPVLGKAA